MNPFCRCLMILALLSVGGFAVDRGHAGQVVTKELRQWAREAVARESALPARMDRNTVGVLYFDNQTGRPELDPLRKGLTIMLITDLAKIETIAVVERARLQALVDELDLSATGLVDPATAPRVARLTGAAFLIGGRLLAQSDTQIHIDGELVDTQRRAVLGNPAGTGPFEELLRMEKEVLFEIVRLLGLALDESQVEELKKPLSDDLDALMFWFQGIIESDRREYMRAAAFYGQALEADPSLEPAAEALDELRKLELISPVVGTGAVLERLRRRVSVNTGPTPNPIVRRDRSDAASVLGPATQQADVNVTWR